MDIKFGKLNILGVDKNGESSLPNFDGTILSTKFYSELDEDDELFLNYDPIKSSFPYRKQDNYFRVLKPKTFDTVILENEFLKAEFIPSLGGRLWSLYDKKNNKELLYKNKVFRLCNLATRNAWFSGGIEWNCGITGHSPYTCSTVYSEYLYDGDTPIFRIYEFERVRKITYQIDFSLPSGFPFLRCRVRVVNELEDTNTMYWWTNVAVEGKTGTRIITPSEYAYTIKRCNDKRVVYKKTVPNDGGVDITYPENDKLAQDFFWKTANANRKYICAVDKDGYGLLQFSTDRLKGRKLFVWGQGEGSFNWQKNLTGDGEDGKYFEIQSGLASTQYENLPMPPNSVWEWFELYGSISLDKTVAHGDFKTAQNAIEEYIDKIISKDELNILLQETKSIALKSGKTVTVGGGYGALENMRRAFSNEKPLSSHLNFTNIGEEQNQWITLLKEGTIGLHKVNEVPSSWMKQGEWITLLEKSIKGKDKNNWYAYMELSASYLSLGLLKKSKNYAIKSINLENSAWANFLLATVYDFSGNTKKCAEYALKAYNLLPNDISIIKFAVQKLSNAKEYKKVMEIYKNLDENVKNISLIYFYSVKALLETGDVDTAEKMLFTNEEIKTEFRREGEKFFTELWYRYCELKAKKEGCIFNENTCEIPSKYDFNL